MGAFETKIADALRSIALSLQLSMLIPAICLVGGLFWLLMPSALTGSTIVAIGLPVITVSYLLNAFNMVIIRAFEGYILAGSVPLEVLRNYQLEQFYRHHHRIYQYKQKITGLKKLENEWQYKKGQYSRELLENRMRQLERWQRGWRDRISHEQERLEERYSPIPDRVLATGLGNAIAAFELYPERRYWIDMAHLWPRFVPALLEKKYAAFIENEKAILDFFVNLLFASGVLWIVAVGVFAGTGRPDAGALFVLLPFSAFLLYRGSCVAAVNWGTTVKSAFDLYRFELKKALNLQLPEGAKLSDERRMWRGISEFLAYGRLENFDGFNYASAHPEMPKVLQKEKTK